MKSERRHELRENDLVHALTVARDYVDEHGGRIGMIVVGIIFVIGAGSFYTSSRATAMEDVWKQRALLKYTDPETGLESLQTLRELTKGVTDRTFVMDSLMDQGRQALMLAQQVPAPPGKEFNEIARQAFAELLEEFPDNRVALSVARLGLATVEQNAFVIDKDMSHKDNARKLLTEIIQDTRLNGLPVQTVATQRREALDECFTRITLASADPGEDEAPVDEPADAVDDPADADDNVDTP